MRITRLDVRRLPGIDAPFIVEDLAPGLNVVLGPNASGKTSLRRAVLATLWPGAHGLRPVHVVSLWEDAGAELRAELDGGVGWQRDGADVEPPRVPAPELARCYSLGLPDLLEVAGGTERELVQRVRLQMAGGYDVGAVAGRFTVGKTHGRKEEKAQHGVQTSSQTSSSGRIRPRSCTQW